jgi:hypothetical protein
MLQLLNKNVATNTEPNRHSFGSNIIVEAVARIKKNSFSFYFNHSLKHIGYNLVDKESIYF